MEDALSRNFPPPLRHPEQFYGFIGVAIASQVGVFTHFSRRSAFPPLHAARSGGKTILRDSHPRSLLPRSSRTFGGCVGTIDLVIAAFFILAFRDSPSFED